MPKFSEDDPEFLETCAALHSELASSSDIDAAGCAVMALRAIHTGLGEIHGKREVTVQIMGIIEDAIRQCEDLDAEES